MYSYSKVNPTWFIGTYHVRFHISARDALGPGPRDVTSAPTSMEKEKAQTKQSEGDEVLLDDGELLGGGGGAGGGIPFSGGEKQEKARNARAKPSPR